MTVYRFTGPSTRRQHKGTCPGCGKKVTRSKTFERTVNPFNRHATEDRPKTWDEVNTDVHAEADAWVPDFRCQTCEFIDWVNGMTADQLRSWIRIDGYSRDSARRLGQTRKYDACVERVAAYEVRLQDLDALAVSR